MKSIRFMLILALGLQAACSTNRYYDPTKKHHTPSGFKNIHYEDTKGLGAFLKWKWQQWFKELPRAEDDRYAMDAGDPRLLKNNMDQTRLTWIGHATFFIRFKGLNILTDPQFSERASPLSWIGPKRVVPPAFRIADLPEIDAVIISHDHYDSLDENSVKALAAHNSGRPLTFIVPLGIKAWLEDLGMQNVRMVELDWEQAYVIKDVKFIAEPSQHWSKRSLFDAYERLWASWVIESGNKRIFFAGDTGYADHFKHIGEKYGGFDLALLPIGAYAPRWFMKPFHVNPAEAVQIHVDLGSAYSVAMHWGTFILTDEPLDEPPHKLRRALRDKGISESRFEVYKHGETRRLNF